MMIKLMAMAVIISAYTAFGIWQDSQPLQWWHGMYFYSLGVFGGFVIWKK